MGANEEEEEDEEEEEEEEEEDVVELEDEEVAESEAIVVCISGSSICMPSEFRLLNCFLGTLAGLFFRCW